MTRQGLAEAVAATARTGDVGVFDGETRAHESVLVVEGRAAQILHVGSYADEAPTIEKLHAFIGETGLIPHGKHHEIYLSDPNRTPAERLRTVIRQPVRST